MNMGSEAYVLCWLLDGFYKVPFSNG